ncbi:MAG TPA: DNA polymerase/3'-5' exonuclease PolX [Thermomicrobiales bacterium]|nr:DNA polymerase/3'-5' exonuclease PolX [Thermomicrobiales bacterium]
MARQLSNAEVAATFRRLADLLAIRGENRFKVGAYRRAAESIEQLGEALAAIRRRDALEEIPGVGEEIAEKIGDLLDTGSFRLLREVEAAYPPGVAELLTVPDIGPKRARTLYEERGVDSLDALRHAIEEDRLGGLPGFGADLIARIAAGLATPEADERRLRLDRARALAADLIAHLRERAPAVGRLELAGSARRYRETVGDLDLVAAAEDPGAVVDAFAALPGVARVEMRGPNRCRVTLAAGPSADLRVLPARHWGSLLHHFTGNKYHNIRLRDLALARGARMSEYGYAVGDDGPVVTCATEEEVYAYLGMQYVPPPMRENTGEIDLALAGTLPTVVQVGDLRGDLHLHTTWSDGAASVREMAQAARERGYAYICVTDHSQGLGVAHGLSPERLREQRAEIARVNAELAPFRVLQGAEVEVRADGGLDFPDDVLAGLDLVVAAVHTGLRQGRERLTARALAALRHPLVDVLAHPTGRLVGGRAGGDFDLDALYAEAATTGTALEIDGDPARLDLRDTHARAALAAGCTISVDSDAHALEGLANIEYGVGTAQRAWATPDRVLNTLPLDALLARCKRARS